MVSQHQIPSIFEEEKIHKNSEIPIRRMDVAAISEVAWIIFLIYCSKTLSQFSIIVAHNNFF